MNIIISNSSDQPIYEQITDQIKNRIMRGELKGGDALPSMRTLESLRGDTLQHSDLSRKGTDGILRGIYDDADQIDPSRTIRNAHSSYDKISVFRK